MPTVNFLRVMAVNVTQQIEMKAIGKTTEMAR